MKEMVITQHGEPVWNDILRASDYPTSRPILATDNVKDERMYEIMRQAQRTLRMPKMRFYEALADYWICVFGPRFSPRQYEDASNSREFLASLADIHQRVSRRIRGAKPPTITIHWLDEDSLELHYESERELFDLMIAMTRAVGRYFDDDIDAISKVDDSTLRVDFELLASDMSAAE